MDGWEWFDNLMENMEDALWADPTRDPAALAEDHERQVIDDIGCNLAGVPIPH